MANTVGVYPGTFDPFTYGHADITKRALDVVDTLIVGVAEHSGKSTLFSLAERLEMVKEEVAKIELPAGKNLLVKPIDNLLIDFANQAGAKIIFRGLRAISDFELEFKLCIMNRRLDKEIETIFLMAGEKYQFISSNFVKEIGSLGGDISSFVSPEVAQKLTNKFEGAKLCR